MRSCCMCVCWYMADDKIRKNKLQINTHEQILKKKKSSLEKQIRLEIFQKTKNKFNVHRRNSCAKKIEENEPVSIVTFFFVYKQLNTN